MKSNCTINGGISEGINPDPGMVYTQNTAAGVVDRIVPEFLLLLKEKGHYSEKLLIVLSRNKALYSIWNG